MLKIKRRLEGSEVTVEKKDLELDWNKIYCRLKNKIDTSGYWGTKVDGNCNCQLCNGTLLLAYLRKADLTEAKSKFQAVYGNSRSYLGTSTGKTQNIPSLYPHANRLWAGGDPSAMHDLYALTVGKYKLNMTIGTIPSSKNIWDNWDAGMTNWLAIGYSTKHLRLNPDGTPFDEHGFAQNQMLTLTCELLLAQEARGDTDFYIIANGVLSNWKARFPTLADEKRKEPEQYYEYKREGAKENWEPKVNYFPIKVLSMLMIIYKLHSYGTISQKELATYLDWYKDRVDELTTTNFTNEDCFVELLAAEMLWAQLKGCRYIPSNYACGSLSKIMTEINDKRIYGNAYPLLYLAWTYWKS